MEVMETKMLLSHIEEATSHELSAPNYDLNGKICAEINSKPELPKEAVKFIKARLLKKNPRIQWLALILLETAMNTCKLPFHTQVCTKDFLRCLFTIINVKEIPQQITNKILSLIQQWSIDFNDQQDILPLFSVFYNQLKSKGTNFPKESQSNSSQPHQSSTSNSYSHPTSAVSKELEGAFEAITLANEMIDNHDPTESVKRNEALIIVMQQLNPLDSKLDSIITGNNSSESLLDNAIKMKEDLNMTKVRFDHLNKYTIPPKFIPSCGGQPVQQERISPQNTAKSKLPQKKKHQPKNATATQPKQNENSEYSLTDMLPAENSQPRAKVSPSKKAEQTKQAPIAVQSFPNLLDDFADDKKDTVLPGPSEKQNANPLSKLNLLMENMQKKEEEKAQQEKKNVLNNQMMFNTNMGAMPQLNPMMYASMAYNMQRPMMPSYGFAPQGQQTVQQPSNQNVIKPAVRPEKKKEEPKEEVKASKDDFDDLFSLATNVYSQPIPQLPRKKEPEEEIFKPLPKMEPLPNKIESSPTENTMLFDLNMKENEKPSVSPSVPAVKNQSDLIFGGEKITNEPPRKNEYDDLFSDVNSSAQQEPQKAEAKTMYTGDLLLL